MNLRLYRVWAACFWLLAGVAAAAFFALDASFDPAEREAFRRLLAGSSELLFMLAVGVFALAGFLASWLTQTYFAPARRVSESTRLIAGGNPGHRAAAEGPAELREVADAVNVLAARHEEALRDVEARIAASRRDLDEEKSRLAALMSELAQSVVVCNAEGVILLYNERARRMFTGLQEDTRGASAYLGLGRSLYALLERDLISHALEQLRYRLAQGEPGPVAIFVAPLQGGTLVRAQMAPVASASGAPDASGDLSGFVLLLENIEEEAMRAERRDQLLERLTQSVRASLGSVRAAVENLMRYPTMDAARRQQFIGIIAEEADRLTADIDHTTRDYSEYFKSQRLFTQIRVADMIEAIRRRVESNVGLHTRIEDLDASLWVNVDSFSIVQAACYLAQRLKQECEVRDVRLAAAAAGRYARIDLTWTGARLPASTVLAWEDGVLNPGSEPALTFRDVVNRHHGEAWYESDTASRHSAFRLLLPLARPAKNAAAAPPRPGRPEYYDFDLFHQPGQTRELDDTPLKELTYTVFDTETTGLEPSAGDEIIAIGAVRIVNGRLLAGEVFGQLVDPRRPLQPDSIRVHGIRPGMLKGQPTIEKVLPAFHKFCEDTVLVAHNAAFDMRFLQLKEAPTGVRFTQPVLDTLLLSAVLHENLAAHQLEAIAERFGVNAAGRHTAVGDALITGEIFLKMIPLLAERGIVTLKQARDACERTYYARVSY